MLQDLKLLNALVGEVLEQAADYVVLVVSAVHVHIQLAAVAAAERDVPDSSLCRIKASDWTRFGQDRREIREGPVEKRQVPYFGGRHNPADLGTRGLDQRRIAVNLNGLSHASGFEIEVERRLLAYVDLEVSLDRFRKALGF